MSKICVLDKHVAELIAAGEVVERPASVVKEMMENCLDAGARRITVEIRDGGISYIRIADDGCGIAREDVPTAFLRHATSKVHDAQDLTAIGTLGFRGEALASVAAVARVELTTCAAGEIVGTHYVIHGGEEVLIEDAGCPAGSTFVIEDLFYNVPARMKFLKKDVSEGNAVAAVVERLALSHPEVSVRFIRSGRTEIQTPGDGDLLSCIRAVFGKPFSAGLIPVDYTMGGVHVHGYICRPQDCRQNRTMQHFFINARYVKTQTGMIALERAYKGVTMVGRFPTCVLYLDMPPETVDANVHPAKLEVRFVNEKPVFDAVYFGVRSALEGQQGLTRVLLRDERGPAQPERSAQPTVSARPAAPEMPAARPVHTPVTLPMPQPSRPVVADPASDAESAPSPTPVVRAPEPPVRAARPSIDVFFDDEPSPGECSLEDGTLPTYAPAAFRPAAAPVTVPAAAPAAPVPTPESVPAPQPPAVPDGPQQIAMDDAPAVRLIGELFSTYIVAQMGDSVYLIDKHATHERLIYNKLCAAERADAQLLLAPVDVSVSREEHTALLENLEVLQKSGFELEDFGGRTVLVRAFPMILSGEDIPATVREIAAHLAEDPNEVSARKLDWIYASSACRAAAKAGDSNSPAELQALAEAVLLRDEVRYCPHGRPVCIEMTRKEIERRFGRLG